LIAVGVLMTLQRMGYIYFSWNMLWPLVLIALGASVLVKAVTRRGAVDSMAPAGNAGADDSVIDVTAILGGYQRRIAAPRFRGGEITAVMGGCELDLRSAGLEGEAVINVFALCGGIAIKVPPEWTVVLQGTPVLGGFEEKTTPPPDASKRLIIKGYAIMGGLEVRN
jgi:hypothetical protein